MTGMNKGKHPIPVEKRIFDILIAVLLLVILFPIYLIIACCVLAFIGCPILFTQVRPGYKGKPFLLNKFRTMIEKKDPDGNYLADQQRMTMFGKFLRSFSLDELPELVNVIKGEMSLVGPRPLLMQYLDLYSPEQTRRMDVLPGITGWAQVNGRNSLSWEEKFKHDVWYVDHWSFWFDLKILILTLANVILRKDINQAGHATSEEFKGN